MKLYVVLVTGYHKFSYAAALDAVAPTMLVHAANAKEQKTHFCVLEGGAQGIDEACGDMCEEVKGNRLAHPANWTKQGRGPAGPIRNSVLLESALAYHAAGHEVHVEAFPAPDSKGTRDMIAKVQRSALVDRLRVTELQ
jgi:hypothetical protein